MEPPLRPKWAILFSAVAFVSGAIAVALFHVVWTVPLVTVLAWTLGSMYLTIGFAWSCLEWPTRNAAVRGNNAFVAVAVCTFIAAAVFSAEGMPFPVWGTRVLVVSGLLGYSVLGICGIRNFIRWLNGAYSPPKSENPADYDQESRLNLQPTERWHSGDLH